MDERRDDVEPDLAAPDAAQDLDHERGERPGTTPATQTTFAMSGLPATSERESRHQTEERRPAANWRS